MGLARHLLLVLLVFSVLAMVSAAPLEIDSKAINHIIPYDGTASYIVTVTNTQVASDIVRLRPASFVWGDVKFDNYEVTVPASSSVDVGVKVKPPASVRVGEYAIDIYAVSTNTKTKATGFLKLQVNTERPFAKISSSIPSEVDVGRHAYNIILEDTGSSPINGAVGRIESPLFEETIEFDIPALKPRVSTLAYSGELAIAPEVKPGRYRVSIIVLDSSGAELNRERSMVTVLSSGYAEVDEQLAKNPISRTHTITITNKGNEPIVDVWKADFGLFERSFTNARPEPTLKTVKEGKAIYTWDYMLNPGQAIVITYTTSYLSLLIAFVILIIAIIVVVTQTARQFSLKKEVISDLKEKALRIKLTLKNNTSKEQNNLVVEDLIKSPLKSAHDFGTVKPAVIKKEAQGMKLVWKIPVMAPSEVRIFSYTVKSSMSVLGRIKLPPAILKLKSKNNKTVKLFSNGVAVIGTSDVKNGE